jgi:hypothetical protein
MEYRIELFGATLPTGATLDALLEACPRLRAAANGTACGEETAAGALLFDKSF